MTHPHPSKRVKSGSMGIQSQNANVPNISSAYEIETCDMNSSSF